MCKKLTYLFSILLFLAGCSQKQIQIKTLNNDIAHNNSKIIFNEKDSIEVHQKAVDTIINWQLYAGNTLLFKSNEVEKIKSIAEFDIRNNYENLNFFIFYDFHNGEIERKMEFKYGDKIIGIIQEKGMAHSPFKLPLTYINAMNTGYLNKEIDLIYFDDINKNGILIGSIKFIAN